MASKRPVKTCCTLAETEEARDSARAEVAEQADRIAGLESERDRLDSELSDEREAHAATQASLEASEAERREQEEVLASRDARIQELTLKRDNLSEERARLEDARDTLQRELAQVRDTAESRAAELETMQSGKEELALELAQVRAVLPAAEGGTLDLETAEAAAGESAAALLERMNSLRQRGGDRATLEEEVQQLQEELRHNQRLVSRVAGGTLYELQPGQSLGDVAARFYRDANRWPAIFEANRHVLDNPDQVYPGFTLLLP